MTFHALVQAFRRAVLVHYLVATGWNVSAAARALGIQPSYLWRLMRQSGLRRPGEVPRDA